jgi:hypothetical protein
MISNSKHDQNAKHRILLFSERNIFEREVWRCSWQEFEGILQEIDSVEVVAPKPKKWYPYGKRVALRLGEYVRVPLNPGITSVNVNQEYDMFLAVCEKPSELLHLQAVKGWRDQCKTSVCVLPEFYVKEIPTSKSSLDVLNEFDYVIFMFNVNEPFKKIIKGQGQYLPAGIDTLRFCPYPNPPARCIDVLSIGRKASAVHKALMRMAREDGKFYVYDTINDLHAYNLDEHRLMMANMAKRSRYFIVSPGKFDNLAETGGQSEFGYRYFEAAAPGTVMIGMRPANNKEFDKIFNWQDAVIEVPFTSDEIVSVIRELDKEPERQMKIRQTNVIQCLLNHDWVYRWEAVLSLVGMQPMPMLQSRKQRLKDLAEIVKEAPIELQKTRV